MNLVTIARARDHVKADGFDDALIMMYANAAEAACERLANRRLFATAEAKAAAVAQIPAAMAEAYAAYDASVAIADAVTDLRMSGMQKEMAAATLRSATYEQNAIAVGIVVTDDILAAVLLITGHLYRNREEVTTGQGAAAAQIPMGAKHIMETVRYEGGPS